MTLKHKNVIIISMLLLLCNSAFAYDYSSYYSNPSISTTINYDESTGSIINSFTTGTNGQSVPDLLSNIMSNSSLTDEQYELLQQVQQNVSSGNLPEGYSSWEEYQNSILHNPEIVSLMSNTGASDSPVSKSSTYQRIQNAYLVMPTAVQAAGYMNQLKSYDEAFHNTDMQMMMPYKERMASRFANQYAVVDNLEHLPTKYEPTIIYSSVSRVGSKQGMWVRPYASTGSVNFENGPKAYNSMYGVYIGGDSSMKHLSASDFQYSVYAAYNGTHQSYGENTISSNGGLMGVTGSWYGRNAFAALTINAGANNAQLETFYMTKDYPMFTAGAAGKIGYNFELADGKFIIQPSYMMSYSFVTPFEKGVVAGKPIESKPLNVMNISPGIKFIGNLKHGWQPYAEARMVWNLFDKTDYSTAYVEIPSISIKPYAQYGFGIQKLWGERSTGFLQVTMRNGGRNEVAFSAGYKCDLGE